MDSVGRNYLQRPENHTKKKNDTFGKLYMFSSFVVHYKDLRGYNIIGTSELLIVGNRLETKYRGGWVKRRRGLIKLCLESAVS